MVNTRAKSIGRTGAIRLRTGIQAILATGLGLLVLGCAHRLESQQRKMMAEVYQSNADMYGLLESAFDDLGREYYVLYQEYQDAGNQAMAERTRRRADNFHGYSLKLHQYKVLNDNKLARLQNGGGPVVVTRKAGETPSETPQTPALNVQPVEIPQSYPMPAVQPAPATPAAPETPAAEVTAAPAPAPTPAPEVPVAPAPPQGP